MRTIYLIVLSIFIAQISLAQQDTLIIKLDDYGQITIMTDKLFSKKEKTLKFDDIYSKFYTDFQKIDKSDMRDSTFNIRYMYDEKFVVHRSRITIQENKNTTKVIYFYRKNFQIIKPFNYTLHVKLSTYNEMEIAVNEITDFKKITQFSIDSLYKNARIDLLGFLGKRSAHKIIYKAENNILDLSSVFTDGDGAHDYISLYPSFGMSIINSNFAPEIDFNIEFILSKKNKPKYKFGVNASFLFIQDKNDFFKIYTYKIANLNYHLFIRDNSSHKFSVGYMFRKTGPHFSGDTWTASWQYNKKHVGLKLGGYYTKNLEGEYVIIPSIGINFGF